MKQEILKAKIELYYLLLKCNNNELSNNELDIISLLLKDKQVRSLFDDITKI